MSSNTCSLWNFGISQGEAPSGIQTKLVCSNTTMSVSGQITHAVIKDRLILPLQQCASPGNGILAFCLMKITAPQCTGGNHISLQCSPSRLVTPNMDLSPVVLYTLHHKVVF